jgi:chemotaxis protein MotB
MDGDALTSRRAMRNRRRHATVEAEAADSGAAPGWFVTYADLMSLLLTFFILIVSMSDLRTEPKVVQAVDAMQRQFGYEAAPTGEMGVGPGRRDVTLTAPPKFKPPASERLGAAGGSIAFAENSAELTDGERQHLEDIVAPFRGSTQKIEIRGHSTRRPLADDSPFADHWDLAYARCREVMRLTLEAGIDAKRLRLSVAGEHEPVYKGDDARERRDNSRVEVFLLNEFADP